MSKYFIIFLLVPFLAFSKTKAPPIVNSILLQPPTPLLGITAIDDFLSDVEEPNASAGGAMEMQRYFSTIVISELDNCLSSTQKVFNDWYTSHGLIPSQQKQTKTSLTIHIWDKEAKGIFEAGYKLSQQPPYVRISLDYFQLNGDKLPVETIQTMANGYQLAKLWQNLSKAIECD